MIHPERRRENLKKIEEMDKHDTEPLQPDWKTWCMNKKVDMVEVVRCKDCKFHHASERLNKCWCEKDFIEGNFKRGEVGVNCCCENCGWSEIVGSPIMCNYSGHRTWRDECCEAWKPKEKETNMVEVVRCKDCKYGILHGNEVECEAHYEIGYDPEHLHELNWFCADGERKSD